MTMWMLRLICSALCLHVAMSYYQLKPLSYIQIPTSLSKGVFYYQGLDRKAAVAGAYDFVHNIVYVIGSTPHLLHGIDIADPTNPQRLFTHQFTVGEGVPKAIAVCGNEIAVALESQTDVNEGHVRFYRTFTKGSGETDIANDGYITVLPLYNDPLNNGSLLTSTLVTVDRPTEIQIRVRNQIIPNVFSNASFKPYEVTIAYVITSGHNIGCDGGITVLVFEILGPHPSHIQYTDDCASLLVPNEGEAGKDEAGRYKDPEGTVSVIHGEQFGNPSVRQVDFQAYDMGQPSYNSNVRVPSLYIPTSTLSTLTTFSKDAEPEYVAISADAKKAWVTLPENNAIAEITMKTGVVSNVYPLPLKDWSQAGIDTSDRDGGVHRRMYPGLKSLRQPTVIKAMDIGSKTFLFTADEGTKKVYTRAVHGFDWTDASSGRTLSTKIDASQPTLQANAANDEFLGRLEVSNIDGKNAINQKYMELTAFGGRGFSIWDSTDFRAPVYDSEGSLEEYMESFDKSVFNSDYYSSTAAYQSPEVMRDSVSDNQGAAVSGLDVKDDNGTVYLVAGTKSTGTLFLYTVDTSSGQPAPTFQSIHRAGQKDLPWNDLYKNKTAAGDLYISEIGIIPSDHSPVDKPLVYVISSGSGAMSLYEIEEIKQTGN